MDDLNAKNTYWGCNTSNKSGKTLLQYFLNKDIDLHIPNAPTHYCTTGRPEILDIVITKNIQQDLNLQVVQDLSSDHNPIQISLTGNQLIKQSTRSFINWNRFTIFLKNNMENIRSLKTTQEIDMELKTLTHEIQHATKICTKEITANTANIVVLPVELRQMIKDKRKARKKAQRTCHPDDISYATKINNQLRLKLRDFHNSRWNNKIESLNSNRSGLWKLIKALKTKRSTIPPLQGTNGIGYTNIEKAEILATSIERQCTPNDPDPDNEDADELEEEVLDTLNQIDETPPDLISTATLQEIDIIIRKLKHKKAPGDDLISNKTIKEMPRKAKVKLLNIINASLRLNYFPTDWKLANIINIPKPSKDWRYPENHRPISLLPAFSKIFERIILSRLLKEVKKLDLLPSEQFGFRKGHSTNQQTLRLVELIHKGFAEKNFTAIAYMDVSKAFDKVWHHGLIHKLNAAGISTNLVKIIRSFLQKRSFKVKVEDSFSSNHPILAGVPQGSVLGPILYNLYTHDIPKNDYSEIALFADDTAIISQCRNETLTVSRLEKSLDEIVKWMDKWKIGINNEKTQAVFHTRKRKLPPAKIEVKDATINWSNEAKYLGLLIDRKLLWNKHTCEMKKIGLAAISNLKPLLENPHLDLNCKRLILTSIIRPVVTYCIATWGAAAKVHIDKIQVIQNKILRIITKAPWFITNEQLHRDLNVLSIRRLCRYLATKFFKQIEEHENEILKNILNYKPEDCRPSARRPRLIEILDAGPF